MRGGIPASASVTSFAAVYGASAAGDDVGEVDGLWTPEDWNGTPAGALHEPSAGPCPRPLWEPPRASRQMVLLEVADESSAVMRDVREKHVSMKPKFRYHVGPDGNRSGWQTLALIVWSCC